MEIYQTRDCLNVKEASLIRSTVENADLTGSLFNKVRMTGLTIRDADLSNSRIESTGLRGSTFSLVDLTDACFDSCTFGGATIDGISIVDLIAAYRAKAEG